MVSIVAAETRAVAASSRGRVDKRVDQAQASYVVGPPVPLPLPPGPPVDLLVSYDR